jgi:hypothetical protein
VQFAADDSIQTLVLRQPENEADVVDFAPAHDAVATESAVTTQHDSDFGPAAADASGNAPDFLQRSGC